MGIFSKSQVTIEEKPGETVLRYYAAFSEQVILDQISEEIQDAVRDEGRKIQEAYDERYPKPSVGKSFSFLPEFNIPIPKL